MAINRRPPCFPNAAQIRVKTFQTFALMLLDKYPATFNMILNDGKRTGFYVRTADNVYRVGSLQLESNVVPLSSDGLSPEEAEQILVKWTDITDRPVVSPQQIDDAVMHPVVPDGYFTKVIVNMQPESEMTLEAYKWYIINGGTTDDYYFRLPAGQANLTSIKVTVIGSKVANVEAHAGGTISGNQTRSYVTNCTVEFVFDANTNDWLVIK